MTHDTFKASNLDNSLVLGTNNKDEIKLYQLLNNKSSGPFANFPKSFLQGKGK